MLKTILRVLITMATLTILGIVILFFYSQNRTYANAEDEIGNTSGNIYNGGLFCEQDGKIYFSNDNDDGSLYVMNSDCTGFKKISAEKAVFINADENYLYYIRANNTREDNSGYLMFNNNGVYRIRHNGTDLKAFTGNPGAYLTLKGNNVYFQRYDAEDGLCLYKYKTDATDERLLVKDAAIPAAVIKNVLYYAGHSSDQSIHTFDLSSFTDHPVIEGSYLYPVYMGNYIYYIDLSDKNKIYRMNRDGTEPTRLVNRRCSTYNITNSGKYLYYEVDDSKHNGVYRLDLETMKEKLLLEGDYKQINVTENFVFFKASDNKKTYAVAADGVSEVNVFDAPGSEE